MENWRYKKNGSNVGPVSEARLKSLYASGEINKDTLVWTKSFGGAWKRYAEAFANRPDDPLAPNNPPAIEKSENFWAWLTFGMPPELRRTWPLFIFAAPLVCAILNILIRHSTGSDLIFTHASWASRIPLAILFLATAAWFVVGARAIRKTGEKNATAGIFVWLVSVPFYLSWCWWSAAVASNFISMTLGLGLPDCQSDIVKSRIFSEFAAVATQKTSEPGVTAADLNDVQQLVTTDQLKICDAKVRATNGQTYPVRYKLQSRGSGMLNNTIEGLAISIMFP